MGVGRDGVNAGVAMPGQMIDQIVCEMCGQRGHRTPPTNRCSFAVAMVRIKTGVASRYQ